MKSLMLRPAQAFAAAALLGTMPTLALANDGPYLGLEGGWNYENNQNLVTSPASGASARFDNGFVAGLNGGYSFANGLRPELAFDWRRNDVRKFVTPAGSGDGSGFDAAYTGFGNLWYDLKGAGLLSKLHPYLGGGVGAARLGLRHYAAGAPILSGYDTVFAWQGGAGLGYDLTRNLSLSLDYRYVQTDRGSYTPADARYRANSALFGVRYTFAAPPPPPPAPVAPPPAPVAAVAPPPPPPVDGDDDGDGVPNSRDKCPGTPKGFKVDAFGCIIEQTVVLRAVNFEYNSDALTAPSKETLDGIATALAGQPDLNVEIAGHTDARGAAAYNLKLSQRRAESVRAYLVSKGAPTNSLVAKGYGKTKPIASNDTEEGRAENRRVEFVVLNKPTNVKVKTEDSTAASKSAAEQGDKAPAKKKASKKAAAKKPAADAAPAAQ